MKNLLTKFSGISIREKELIDTEFVLDPTFLLEKKYYLNLIKNFEGNINKDSKYIFCY